MSIYIPNDSDNFCVRNTSVQTCHNCGKTLQPGEGYRVEEWDYPWDGSDTEGSITEKIDEWWVEPPGVDCMKRDCESGHNLNFLREVATGEFGVGGSGHEPWAKQWRDMCRLAYNAHVSANRELAQMIARGEAGALRESGWGGIGGSQARRE